MAALQGNANEAASIEVEYVQGTVFRLVYTNARVQSRDRMDCCQRRVFLDEIHEAKRALDDKQNKCEPKENPQGYDMMTEDELEGIIHSQRVNVHNLNFNQNLTRRTVVKVAEIDSAEYPRGFYVDETWVMILPIVVEAQFLMEPNAPMIPFSRFSVQTELAKFPLQSL